MDDIFIELPLIVIGGPAVLSILAVLIGIIVVMLIFYAVKAVASVIVGG